MQARSSTVYVATTAVEPEWEAEFNRWYDEEHVPALLGVPGYLSARRYVAVEGAPKYFAFYEIASIDAYRSPAHDVATNTPWTERIRPHRTGQLAFYQQIVPAQGLLRGPADPDGAAEPGGLMVVRMDIDPEHEADFNAWADQEHLPALCTVPGVLGARRFRAIEGSSPAHMTTYYMTDPSVQASAAWQQAADTPWRARVRQTFRNSSRVVYRPLPVVARTATGAATPAS